MIDFLRHFPVNLSGICYGQSDVSAVVNIETMTTLLSSIKSYHQIYSSPLSRCLSLAQTVAKSLDLDLQVDERLMEISFGQWEMKPWDQIPRIELDLWAADVWNFQIPGGESVAQVCARVHDFKQELDLQKRILIVSHGGVAKVWRQQPFDGQIQANYHSIQAPFGKVVSCKDFI